MTFDKGLESARVALKLGLGLAAFLAGLDKFTNLLTDWTRYVAPAATAVLPVDAETLMQVVGVVEMVVGAAILTGRWTRPAAYVAAAWLVAIAVQLTTAGMFLDVAVRDVTMAIAAYTLARLTEAQAAARSAASSRVATRQAAAA
jgi:uncharacterized membrane protein YphA (DoxX/SURF4 family)